MSISIKDFNSVVNGLETQVRLHNEQGNILAEETVKLNSLLANQREITVQCDKELSLVKFRLERALARLNKKQLVQWQRDCNLD